MNIAEQAEQLYLKANQLRNNGQGLAAVEVYKEASQLYQQLDDKDKVADCQHLIGVSYKVENDIPQAIEEYQKALELYQQTGNSVRIAAIYRDIGISYDYAHQYHEALPWLLKAVEVGQQAGDLPDLAISQAKLGLHYLKDKDLAKAQEWMTKGLTLIRQTDTWFYEMTILLGLADLKVAQQQHSQALDLLWAGLGITLDAGDSQDRRLAQFYGGIAQCYLAGNNPARATRFFAKAIKLLEPMADNVAELVYQDIAVQDFIQKLQHHHPDHYQQVIKQVNLDRLKP